MIKTILKIEGMMCGMCEAHMNDLMRKEFHVKKVSSSASKGETVVLSEEELDIQKVQNTIKEIGYSIASYTKENYEKKGLMSIFKK